MQTIVSPECALMPPTERSPAELTLVRAVEDLLAVAPIELALTKTMGLLL
jgi:hypothetical protein